MGSKEEEYKEMFLAEALDNYEELNKLFTKLEKDTSNKKVVDHIFRITHTLKGNAMGMGFEAIAELGHVMEDIFSEVKEGNIELDDDLFNSLFKANDKLGQLIDSLKTGKKVSYKGIRTKLAVYLKKAREEAGIEVSTPAEEVKPVEKEQSKEEVKASLFDRLGGKAAVDAAVDLFYEKVIADDIIKHFFDKVNMDEQKAKQKIFLSYAFGGLKKYEGKDMRSAHAKMNLKEEHFNAVAGHLVATLEELKIAPELINEVVAIALSVKDDVLAGDGSAATAETVEEEIVKEEQKVEDVISDLVENKSDDDEDEEEDDDDEEEETKIAFSDLVQVPVRKLDSLMNLVGELIIERDTLVAASVESGYGTNMFARLQRITSDLQYGVMDVRLVQIGFLFNKFHRVIRDVAAIEKKGVELVLEGTENEIDRNILKIMSDSLVHLIRNSVSHGIESPEERKKAGKPEKGTVTLLARNEKDSVIIEVIDDGAGIDAKIIGKKAMEKGIITKDYFQKASDDELIMLIFEPGFSNAEAITEVSGRGVGMDVVKRATESIGGNIKVTTTLGEGSTIQLLLPSSMAVKGALLFELNKQEYAVALSYTEAVVSFTKSDIHKVSNGLMASYLGKTISIIFLNDLYDISGFTALEEEGALHKTFDVLDPNKKLDVLVTSYGNKYVGFVVDKLLQQKEIVEKTLAPPIDRIELISGATILGNGNVCLVLDIANIINTLYKDKSLA